MHVSKNLKKYKNWQKDDYKKYFNTPP
jgi:hypothetical protein